MGNLAQPLLQALGGIAGAPGVGAVPPESDGTNQMSQAIANMINPQPDSNPTFGGGNQGQPGGALSAVDAGGQDAPMEGVVRGFKPKHVSFWGALGDQLMKHWGNDPVFAPRIESKNMRHAMEGWTGDPVEAISRISQIPGHEQDAWKLFNEYQDNTRMQSNLDRQNRVVDYQSENIMFNRVAGMMGIATPENWKQMRATAIKIGQDRGVDVSNLIPEEYDPEAPKYIMYGAIKPKDQIRLNQQERDTTSKITHRENQDNQAATNEGGRNTRNATNQAGVQYRHDNPVATPRAPKAGPDQSVLANGARVVYGAGGKRNAKTAVYFAPNGEIRYLNKLPTGKWKVVAPPPKPPK